MGEQEIKKKEQKKNYTWHGDRALTTIFNAIKIIFIYYKIVCNKITQTVMQEYKLEKLSNKIINKIYNYIFGTYFLQIVQVKNDALNQCLNFPSSTGTAMDTGVWTSS